MLFRYMPMTNLRRLVLVTAEMNTERDFFVQAVKRKLEIGGRIVNWISTEYHEHFDLTRIYIGDQLAKLVDLQLVRVRRQRLGVSNRLAYVAKRRVHRMSKCVHDRRLMSSGDNDRFAFACDKVLRHR